MAKSLDNYILRGYNYFALDVIDKPAGKSPVIPLIYKFKSDKLYYPLEITASSEVGGYEGRVDLFFITNGLIDESSLLDLGFITFESGFYINDPVRFFMRLNEKELKEINPILAGFFKEAYLSKAIFFGNLSELNSDIEIPASRIFHPTITQKILLPFYTSPYHSLYTQFGNYYWRYLNIKFYFTFLYLILIFFIIGCIYIGSLIGKLFRLSFVVFGLPELISTTLGFIIGVVLIICYVAFADINPFTFYPVIIMIYLIPLTGFIFFVRFVTHRLILPYIEKCRKSRILAASQAETKT